ncbi:hypothetical protein [Mucilaginibacter psychrotolerans]|uniref:Lipoprotein n=1 Tax=Mucilaginibacter psychrotolerans TaxID=1524096 RepID=A0A4Y8SLR0_9SPHI|nr:hypothetical protein [Mucilaginibacter psychrotolerans]TFF39635.1 hypothetical protein E2R66_04515 [Mucilaginibacter psychrotolerans]
MKTNQITAFGSRAAKLFSITALSIAMALSSCKKDSTAGNAVTEDEAAEVMVQAVDPASGGLALQTTAATTIALTNSSSAKCGVAKDSTITGTGSTATRTYSYNLSWHRLLTCGVGSIPSKLDFTFTGGSTYSGPRMSSDDNSTGAFTVTGLELGSSEYVVNQTYTRKGTQQSKVRKNRSFSSTVNIITTDVKVSKATQQITSGTGTVKVTGTASTGETFSYSATITFLGSKKANIVFASGTTYAVSW